MRNIDVRFSLASTPNAQVFDILWDGNKLGSTVQSPTSIESRDMWILATGPSINDLDLSKLKGKTVMGLNGAITSCEAHNITPRFYAITDRDFFEHRMHLVEKVVQSGAHCFFSFNGLARICELAPHLLTVGKISLLETVNRRYNTSQLSSKELFKQCSLDPELVISDSNSPKVGWSHNLIKGVFTANTIAYIGCQIAAALKAENVFILGMDLGSSGSTHARSYESGIDARPTTIDKDYEKTILPAFELLSNLQLTPQFYNLSTSSRLPELVMPKLSLKQALKALQS
jgi:Kdo-III transferase WaaZ